MAKSSIAILPQGIFEVKDFYHENYYYLTADQVVSLTSVFGSSTELTQITVDTEMIQYTVSDPPQRMRMIICVDIPLIMVRLAIRRALGVPIEDAQAELGIEVLGTM